jgi:Cd2+/Zn2+-exporting ATPase
MTQAAASPTPITHTAAEVPTSGFFSAKGELYGAIAAGVLLLIGFVIHVLMKQPWAEGFIWASLALGMVYGVRAAWGALRGGKFDIDVLMVVGAGLAAAIGHPEEGALLLFLFTLAGALEELAMQRTLREVNALHKLMPKGAMVLRGGEWIEASAESLVVDEQVRIRPGEAVPVDCVVTVGSSTIDQSAITGESMPRDVTVNDELFAGTINADNALEARVLRPASESGVQKILRLVTQAQEQRESTQQLIDKISQPYSIGVMVVSLLVMLVWWLVFKVPLLGSGEQPGAVYVAITLLIVASPCALIIATPTATLAAIARAARGGVLFKGGQALTRLASVGAICFDKTGTLTFGRPHLYEVHPVAWSDGDELLALAAGLERDSTHPIAQAILEAAKQRGMTPTVLESVDHVIAKGLEGTHKGMKIRLGRYSFAEEFIPVCFRNRTRDVLAKIQGRGHIAVVVARHQIDNPEIGEAAVLIMADAVRPGAAEMVPALHALGVKPLRMLTGDNKATAQRVAEGLKLDGFDADLLPADKLRIVGEMADAAHARKRTVAVIGDGVNDAPALARADVGMAIGTIGTAAALESADVVLLSDSLHTVPWAIKLARRARQTIVANLILALSIIVIMGITTLIASRTAHPVPLSIGVLAHEGGTVLVVLNSLRLLWFKKHD